jgi:peptide/nickel transport system permease protein
MSPDKNITAYGESPARISEGRRILRVMFGRKLVVFGLVVIFAFIIVAGLAPQIAPYDPYQQNLQQTLQQPSWGHLLGTDALGRDTLSRVIFGARTSLMVGVVSVGIAAALGVWMGLVAGYFGGWIHNIIMRFIDSLMAFPMILLALILAALLGSGIKNVIFALGISLTSLYARLMCSQVISVKENDYISAARSLGAGSMRIMMRHLIPNCLPPIIVLITLQLGMAILAEASLSFLGIGIEPPGAAWGALVNDGYKFLLKVPVLSFAPGMAIMVVVFSFNLMGDGLRDALDPRLRGTL